MVSFDVKSLYTSLPIQRTLRVVRECLQREEAWESMTILSAEEIIKLLEVCLTSTYFTFQNNRLSDGVAMGSPVPSVVANIFMEDLEQKAVNTAGECGPCMWRRHVDDVFSILLRKNVERFLEDLTAMDDNITFTVERERDGKLPFLDVSVKRT